jgi:hypothetical protein
MFQQLLNYLGRIVYGQTKLSGLFVYGQTCPQADMSVHFRSRAISRKTGGSAGSFADAIPHRRGAPPSLAEPGTQSREMQRLDW